MNRRFILSAAALIATAAVTGCTPTHKNFETDPEPTPIAKESLRPHVDDRDALNLKARAGMGAVTHFKSRNSGPVYALSSYDLTDKKAPRVASSNSDGAQIVQIGSKYYVKTPDQQRFVEKDARPFLAPPIADYVAEIEAFASAKHLDDDPKDGKPAQHYIAVDKDGVPVELWLDSAGRVIEYIVETGTMDAVNIQLYDFGVPVTIETPQT